jgi:hypothetical protein
MYFNCTRPSVGGWRLAVIVAPSPVAPPGRRHFGALPFPNGGAEVTATGIFGDPFLHVQRDRYSPEIYTHSPLYVD